MGCLTEPHAIDSLLNISWADLGLLRDPGLLHKLLKIRQFTIVFRHQQFGTRIRMD